MGLLQALCLGILPAFTRAQEFPPCKPGTNFLAVASTEDAASLASSLKCSNGRFSVDWFGNVIVSETIIVAHGTSLDIDGAASGAAADGNYTTNIFSVDGGSTLHLTNMTLKNGHAFAGGAVSATQHSRVTFRGDMTLSANSASVGGAIYADASTVLMYGDDTVFQNNHASDSGGAIMTEGSSTVSWDGVMVFMNNSANYSGGSVHVEQSSNLYWSGVTTFQDNVAWQGGAVYSHSSSVAWSGDETTFRDNHAISYGGAIMARGSSNISWQRVTGVADVSDNISRAAIFVLDSSINARKNHTTFSGNVASYGGAIYVQSTTLSWEDDCTAFRNNTASSDGGAIVATGSSTIVWHGVAAFIDNAAYNRGGAVFVNESSSIYWRGNATFSSNTAHQGGAIYSSSSTLSWGGHSTTFHSNYVSENGGAIMACTSTAITWEGVTSFVSNIAAKWGGGVYMIDYSSVSWAGSTTFLNNSALDGSGLFMRDDCVGDWSGTTSFASNRADGTGGGLNVHTSSTAHWTGVTTFTGNTANRGGAMWVWQSFVSWNGNTTFADNIAHADGGAVYATLAHNIVGRGTTTFRNNTASTGNGGAVGLYGSLSSVGSNVSISGDAAFSNNTALGSGGGIFSAANPHGQNFEGVEFWFNSARVGGAVATFGTGNADECTPSPTMFSKCLFIGNHATETGGAVETSFGQEHFESSYFESNSADVGGALRLGGNTTIRDCSFVSNLASRSGPAIAAVGLTAVSDSSFQGNTFLCREKLFLEEVPTEGYPSTARYETVCDGCPPWDVCDSCNVSEDNIDPQCSITLEHTTSGKPGSTLNTLSVDKGYWRTTVDSDNILPCYNTAACLGGQTGSENFCSDGYKGAYCSICENGYSPSLSYTCTRCSESKRDSLVVVASVATMLAVCALGALSAYLLSTNVDERSKTCIPRGMLRVVPLQAFKNIIVVWQILTQFASVANVAYPQVYQTFLNAIDVINLDFGVVVSTGCLWPGVDFHDRLLASTLWPLAALGLLMVTYTMALRKKSASCETVRETIRNKHLSVVLLLLFLVYSSVSSNVFRMFACDPVDDGNSYLRADYRIMCTDAKHQTLQVYAAVMIAVYPVGIPLLYAVLLYRHRAILSDSGANKAKARAIADLWAPYRPSAFYYEVVECGRRLLLTGVVVFIFPNAAAQVAITIMNSLFFFVVSEVLSPYACVTDTWLSRGGQVIILFSMYDALLLKIDVSKERSQSQSVFAAVLVAGHFVLILAVVVEAIGICYAARRKGRAFEVHTPSKRAMRVGSLKTIMPRRENV